MPRGHGASVLASSCCGPDWLGGKEGAPLEEDSVWVIVYSSVVEGGGGGGGGRTMASSAQQAHFGRELRHQW